MLRTSRGAAVRRVAMLSVHTSPLEPPGGGDAGGMNVYVVETAKRLADAGVAVEIFTRATSSDQPPVVEMQPGRASSGTSPPARSRAWPRTICPPSCAPSPPA